MPASFHHDTEPFTSACGGLFPLDPGSASGNAVNVRMAGSFFYWPGFAAPGSLNPKEKDSRHVRVFETFGYRNPSGAASLGGSGGRGVRRGANLASQGFFGSLVRGGDPRSPRGSSKGGLSSRLLGAPASTIVRDRPLP